MQSHGLFATAKLHVVSVANADEFGMKVLDGQATAVGRLLVDLECVT